MDEEQWSEDDSVLFADLGEIFTSLRDEIADVVLHHVSAQADEAFLAVDLCWGAGRLFRQLARDPPSRRRKEERALPTPFPRPRTPRRLHLCRFDRSYVDLIDPASEIGWRYAAHAWDEQVRAASQALTGSDRAWQTFNDAARNWFSHPDPGDGPSAVADILDWLREAGFPGVDLPWVRAGHAIFVAYRPTEPAIPG